MLHDKKVPKIDGLRVDEAHKGGKGASGPSAAQIAAEEAQTKELADLQTKENARVEAMGRKRRGRASLISGEETGMKETLGA
jgi:hypothetical protein